MLGDSINSVLATTATATSSGDGGGGVLEIGNTSGVRHVGSNNSGEEDKGIRGGGGGGGDGDDGDRGFGGNRWPKQETVALLKIRSDMDAAFRDASVKGPLWEEVSRKLAELGYNRGAKKCKEKFENVFKYHKRTKDGRTGKQEGKTYRFFDQLEAFENHPSSFSSPQPPSSQPPPKPQTSPMPVVNPSPPPMVVASHISTVASTTATLMATHVSQAGKVTTGINLAIPSFPSTNPTILPLPQATNPISSSFPNFSSDILSNSTSSSTSSDVEMQGLRKRKRKWKDFFERLMKEVINKQEDMQRKFLEVIEKREHDRLVREDSWRMQEMALINREREILAQERSIAAAKDAAVMSFLQKLSEQQNPGQVQNNPPPPQSAAPTPRQPSQPLSQPAVTVVPSQPPPQPAVTAVVPPQPLPIVPVAQATPASAPAPAPAPQAVINLDIKSDDGDQPISPASSSRWPKVEVEALIKLRTTLDSKYQENGPKGPLWEEISAGMRKLGYNRSSKRCKEKWENINKYFKKVKESNKKRPEDSKTCPYFHQLDALYKEKNKNDGSSSNSTIQLKPENSVPLMVRPEQQWPPPPPSQQGGVDSIMEDLDSDDNQNNQDYDDKDNDDDDEDEEAGGGGYEIVANRPTVSMSSTGLA